MITRWLRRLPSFGEKVVWLLTSTGGLAVVLVSVGLVVFAYFDLRNEVFDSIESRSRVAAMNSGAPLAFDDRASAHESLAAPVRPEASPRPPSPSGWPVRPATATGRASACSRRKTAPRP